MPRHWSPQVARDVGPDSVVGALAYRLAAVLAKMHLELSPLQAARSIVICSTWPPPIGGSRPSS
jgi:hypothetical protein